MKVKFPTLLGAVENKCIKLKLNIGSLRGSDFGLFLVPAVPLVIRLMPGP